LPFVQAAFASNYIAPPGPMVDAFEREIADHTRISHCLALISVTASMYLTFNGAIEQSSRHTLQSVAHPGPAACRVTLF
jgi:dTDP-4-amino-4,6-dideoxygalactose transaminase